MANFVTFAAYMLSSVIYCLLFFSKKHRRFLPFISLRSIGIERVVNANEDLAAGLQSDALCTACEMAVVWMQNQLKQNETRERILNYVNEVNLF